MSKPTTHVLFVIDMSGSMRGLAEDVRGGFNSYVEGLRADKERRYRLTAAVFDDKYEVLCTAAKLADVPRLDDGNYRPRGMTALLDAIGKTVAEFDTRVPTLPDGDRALLVVQTDGHENASKEFRREQIADLIKEREATGRWSCLFLGAGPDAWAQAGGMGFAASQTVRTAATSEGTQASYAALGTASRLYSRGGTGAATAASVVGDLTGDAS